MYKISIFIVLSILLRMASLNAQTTTLAAPIRYPDSHTDGKYYRVNGANLYTVTVGEGAPIFFIAGGPGGAHLGLRSFDSLATD